MWAWASLPGFDYNIWYGLQMGHVNTVRLPSEKCRRCGLPITACPACLDVGCNTSDHYLTRCLKPPKRYLALREERKRGSQ